MTQRLLAVTVALLVASSAALAQVPRKAPELEGGTGWLNTDKPIKLSDLKGKIVLFDFWTYCCINCMHVIPELHRLEKKYAKELVVIGVHSAKFTAEKDEEGIRQAILRYDIEHPVVNDSEFKLFRAFGAKGWPHFTLVDPEGTIVGHASGEGNYELFVKNIDDLIKKFGDKLNRTEIPWSLEKTKETPGVLSFPGKVLASGDRLFIADSGHHRVLVADLAGNVTLTIGGPESGHRDGDFATARFHEPQGMALKGDVLFVADRQNHVLRRVDLKEKSVKTVAGTGKQGWRSEPGPALKTALNSPWDLALDGDKLYVAMAGNHQIWLFDLDKDRIGAFSGTGREFISDGPHDQSTFSQPSGLGILNGKIYVADSEVSAVREVELDPKGKVRTLVGTGLFDFGDKDAAGDEARLQHCIGLAVHPGGLVYVADSYNHKIKTVDPKTRAAKTFLGSGRKGKEDGKAAQFHEPSGLSFLGDTLFIADTNNHRIRACDLKSGEVRSIDIKLAK